MDDEQEHSGEKAQVKTLVAALRATLEESDRRNAPAASGVRELVAALDRLLDDDDGPIRRLLGLVQARPGLPGRSDPKKIDILRRHAELREQGVSAEDAATQVGASARAISRWKNEPVGFAERLDAKLSERDVARSPTSSEDKTGG